MPEIDISVYNNKVGGLRQLQQNILEQLGNAAFVPSHPMLCFHILKCLSYPSKASLTIDETSITAGCEEVKKIFEKKFEFWETRLLHSSSSTLFELFILNLADLEKLPGLQLKHLEESVKEDLAKRDHTIRKYEQLEFVKKVKSTGEQPRDHDQRTLLAFYTRNLDEQQIIVRYLLYGVKTRALTKSRNYFSVSAGMFQSWGDRPYHTAMPLAEQHFDHEKIDRVSHRLLAIGIKEGAELKTLYDINKKKFYERVFKLQPLIYVLNNIKYYFRMLHPLTERRQALFNEMLELYEAKKYYGFYGLALSQVEGLFTEMLATYGADIKKGKSLPEKVKALRTSSENNSSYFDYYEFHIPVQRNKFMHAGIDDDIELKAHDLLFDLMNVLYIYVSLDVPVVELTQTVKKREQGEYLSEAGFNRYFKLVSASVKNKSEFESLKAEIEKFEKDFLIMQLSDNAILSEMSTLIPQTLQHLAKTVGLYTGFNSGKEVNLDDWTIQRIHAEKGRMVEELEGVYEAHKDIFDKLEVYSYFLHNCKKYMPSLDGASVQQVDQLLQQYKDGLNRIGRIADIIRESQSVIE